MNRILLFCALGALWGCRQAAELSGEAITLSCSTSESSKVGALTAGDEVAVYARLDGTETYFLEGEKFITGSDGKTLSRMPAVYYPEPKQAVNFYAYVPYHTGNFSVPSNQSTAVALKKADLCWTNASSTPVATPVSLTFQHLFARLIVQTNQPTEKIACQVVPSGVLNAATAQFTLTGDKSEVFTTGSELIVPVQPLNRLILTVSGIDYVFEGSINLQAGQTTTLNLTLHPSTQTATLSGSSTTAWIASNQSGGIEQTVSNILTLHWANYVPQGATPDKITLTINNTDYTISSGITYANKTFSVPFASSALRYPYTITKITFYSGATQILPNCTQILGSAIYKSGAATLGIKDPANAVLINGIWWATGNLVANGPNGCRIGAPTDCGLYFQFGSLIGWSGGAATTGNDGRGAWSDHVATVKVKPSNLNTGYDPGAAWPTGASTTGLNKPYFSVTTEPYLTQLPSISGYAGVPTTGVGVDLTKSNLGLGRYAPMGVGDPCAFYLGPNWRMPTAGDIKVTTGITIPTASWISPTACTFNLQATGMTITKGAAQIAFPLCYDRASSTVWAHGICYWGDIWLNATSNTYGGIPMVVQSEHHSYTGNAMWAGNGGEGHDHGTNSTHGLVVRCVTPN